MGRSIILSKCLAPAGRSEPCIHSIGRPNHDRHPALAHSFGGGQEPIGMMDSLDFGAAFLAAVPFGHFVVAISAYGDYVGASSRSGPAYVDIDLEPAKHMAKPTERLLGFDHRGALRE